MGITSTLTLDTSSSLGLSHDYTVEVTRVVGLFSMSAGLQVTVHLFFVL